jgi:hypothetical protein
MIFLVEWKKTILCARYKERNLDKVVKKLIRTKISESLHMVEDPVDGHLKLK